MQRAVVSPAPSPSLASDQEPEEMSMSSRVPRGQVFGVRLRSWARDIAVIMVLAGMCWWLTVRVSPLEGSPLARYAPAASGPEVKPQSKLAHGKDRLVRSPLHRPMEHPSDAAIKSDRRAAATAGRGVALEAVNQTAINRRRLAAVVGSFVADAASMGLHWIYDTRKITSLTGANSPEFFDPPSSPFYQYESGEQSPYGDEEMFALKSVAQAGAVDGPTLQKDLYEGFKQYSGRLNTASKKLVAAVDGGCSYPDCAPLDDQAHGLVKVAVVVARYAGSPELPAKMAEAVKAHQSHSLAVETAVDAAKLLEHVILHGSVTQAVEWGTQTENLSAQGKALLENAVKSRHLPHTVAVKRFGQSCHLPGSFESVLHGAVAATSYVEAIRATILAGGDSCSRAVLLGALFAAQDGIQGVPEAWRSKTNRISDVEALAETLLLAA